MCRQSIVFVPVHDAVHQAIEERDNIAWLVGDKALPCCRKHCLHISPGINNEQCYQQPFQTRLCIGISEMLLTELPECRQQVVFFKLLQESIVHQLAATQAVLSFAFSVNMMRTISSKEQVRALQTALSRPTRIFSSFRLSIICFRLFLPYLISYSSFFTTHFPLLLEPCLSTMKLLRFHYNNSYSNFAL